MNQGSDLKKNDYIVFNYYEVFALIFVVKIVFTNHKTEYRQF